MHSSRTGLIIALSLGTLVSGAHAWNDRGHMISAMIAYDELKPETRQQVDDILKAHPQRDLLAMGGPTEGSELNRWIFAKAATWPDLVRQTDNPMHGAEHRAQWHFINYPISRDNVRAPTPSESWDGRKDPDNLIQAMAKVKGELAAPATTPERRAMDLCWIEHLTGDIHQPLHAVALYSKQFPSGDRGGNSFAVRRGDTPTNLHSYWDGLLGNKPTPESLTRQVESLKAKPGMSKKDLLVPASNLEVKDWAKESVAIARSSAYRDGALAGVPHSGGDYAKDTPKLPSDYEEKAKPVAERQIVLSGYRMAELLNQTVVATPASSPTTIR